MVAFSGIVDLSHELYDGMPNIAGNPVSFGCLYTFDEMSTLTQGKLSMQGRQILMPEHCGTHLDVPAHFDPAGVSTAEIALERLVVPGLVLDLSHKGPREAIGVEDLEHAVEVTQRVVHPDTALLVYTGADKVWGQPGFATERPYLPVESAQWVVDNEVAVFGTDLIGMDDPDAWWWPSHQAWLSNGVPMCQQLCNLDQLVGREFLFVALPLRMRAGTASPVRAIALLA